MGLRLSKEPTEELQEGPSCITSSKLHARQASIRVKSKQPMPDHNELERRFTKVLVSWLTKRRKRVCSALQTRPWCELCWKNCVLANAVFKMFLWVFSQLRFLRAVFARDAKTTTFCDLLWPPATALSYFTVTPQTKIVFLLKIGKRIKITRDLIGFLPVLYFKRKRHKFAPLCALNEIDLPI